MKLKDKTTLFIIVGFLIVLLPIFTIATVYKVQTTLKGENPHKQHKLDGFLYFYNSKGELLDKYECIIESCDLATSREEKLSINYYQEGKTENLKLINERYVLIDDNYKINLYDTQLKKVITSFDYIKFYNHQIQNDYLLIQTSEKWGMIQLSDFKVVIDYKYEHLALFNKLEDGSIKSDILLAGNGLEYFLINDKNEIISSYFSTPIYDYVDDIVIVKTNRYFAYTITGQLLHENYEIIDYHLGLRHVLVTPTSIYIFNNLKFSHIDQIEISEGAKVKIDEENNQMKIYVDDQLVKTVE